MIPKFRFKKEVNLSDSINLIPMINLVFLLLIFFLLTGIIQKKEDPSILLPESDQGMKKDSFSDNYTIQVNENGILKLNEKLRSVFRFNLNLDKSLQSFFQGITDKFSEIRKVIQEEKAKQKKLKIEAIEKEKKEVEEKLKADLQNQFKAKAGFNLNFGI